ncbi:MAG TPA: metabolite traffic protein EboE [Nitriliruptoraceae bacterium]|nr:metabolite traffic protein EboE [Nitriliruptoraceae bacterium]
MRLDDGLGHLTYSTLVHPADTWADLDDSLRRHLPAVHAKVDPTRPMGVSIRLAAATASTLTDDPVALGALSDFFADQELYVYTANAFPYGPFKGQSVMEQVYEPDWTTDERVDYTNSVADIMAKLAPTDVTPSIQTAPLAYRPNVVDSAYVERFTHNVLRVIAHMVGIERRTGQRVKLAIEPEPHCFLDSTRETVDYFQSHLYGSDAIRTLASLGDLPLSEAAGALRRHLGVVFDICHQSVAFEDIPDSLAMLSDNGIPVFKLQEAAALWVEDVDRDSVEALRSFTDTIYLSQTTERRDDGVTRYLHLADAIAAWEADPNGHREWRTHFHVPVFLDDLGPFRTTRFAVEEALAAHRAEPISDHLEIETYTWDVLPEHLKTGDIVEYVSRELEWVRGHLVGGNRQEARP